MLVLLRQRMTLLLSPGRLTRLRTWVRERVTVRDSLEASTKPFNSLRGMEVFLDEGRTLALATSSLVSYPPSIFYLRKTVAA